MTLAGHVPRAWPLRQIVWAISFVVLSTTAAHAQANLQLWGNITFNWIKGDRLTYEIDLEPKTLLSAPEGEPGWRNLDTTPSVEYAWKNWLDVTGELVTGFTKQTDDEDSFELAERVGMRFHLLSRNLPTLVRDRPIKSERPPKRRLILRDLTRIEQRSLFYTDDEPNSNTWRFRNRFELLFPLNREKITDDGAKYLTSDWEWFVPLGDPTERFANKQRIRAGWGYRRNVHWRFEALYMWTRSRDTAQDSFNTSDNIINFRMKRVF